MGLCTALHDMVAQEENNQEYDECAQCGYIEPSYQDDSDFMYDAMIDDLMESA